MPLQDQNTTPTPTKRTVEVPGAVEVDHVVDPNDPASRAEWVSYMTGSKVASVLGISPWTTRLQLWRQMTGHDEPGFETAHATHGREREPIIRAGTEHTLGCTIVTPRMLVSKANPRHAYSPDGIILPFDFVPARLWECKTTTDKAADSWAQGIPRYYVVQWQWGAYVTGLESGLFTLEAHDGFVPISTRDFPITRDDALIEHLIDAVDDFLTYVDSDTEPPPLGAVVVEDSNDRRVVERWVRRNKLRLKIEKAIAEDRPTVDKLGENASALMTPDGDVLCHWTGGKDKPVETVDWAAIEAAHPGAAKAATRTYVDHTALAYLVPEAVKAHTTTTTTTARSLKMGARK